MTLAPSEDRAETAADRPTAPDRSTAHEKAVDIVMGDRAMVSRLLREHQMLHEAFEHGPAAWAILDSGGTVIASNSLHDRLDVEEGAGAAYRIDDVGLPSGLTMRMGVDTGAEEARGAVAADRAGDDLSADVSREIRTPLNGLVGMAGLLAGSDLPEARRVQADLILRSGRALLAITDDILDLPKIGAGRTTLRNAPFDIGDSIEDTATLFAVAADARGLDLIVRVDPSMPRTLIGDDNRLRRILSNLIGNAIEFTDAGHVMVDADVRVGADDGGDGGRVARIVCRVQDTGRGIAPALCDRLFEGSSRAGPAARGVREGAGQGLAIVAALVEEMGGTVGVESIEGEGTTFHFAVELPVAAPETPRMAREALWGRRVMIVDGDGPRRTILAESLKAWGFDVAPCRGVREGMALMDALTARGRGVDLVVLGERVAEGTAPLFMAALAEREGTPPPVIVSARLAALSLCDGSDGSDGGPVPFDTLPRPVRSACLLESVERALTPRTGLSVVEDAAASGAGTPVPGRDPEGTSDPVLLPRPGPVLRLEAPVSEAEASTPKPASEPEPAAVGKAAPEEGIDILVAEDNEINRFLIEEILREGGHSYRIVNDGIEAVEAWRESRPRLILMDVSMPKMSGDEATRLIRSEERGGHRTPIVALTAHALRGDRDRCMEAGMDDHLTKPVTIASIMGMIEFHLNPAAADAVG